MTVFAILGALLIGLSLGLLGSGGSILTVPVLVYLAHEPEKLAITESLAIVGIISLVGLIPHARQGMVDWRRWALFGLPGVLGTALGTALSTHLSGAAQLSLFAAVMLLAASMMFRPAPAEPQRPGPYSALATAVQGLGVGTLTGVVGVGGGFLIVPALVLLGKLPMRYAVGTSLAIITLNSLTGFIGHLRQTVTPLHWPLMLLFAAIGVVGSLAGSRFCQRLNARQLRRGFAIFLVLMGLFVMWQSAPKMLRHAANADQARPQSASHHTPVHHTPGSPTSISPTSETIRT